MAQIAKSLQSCLTLWDPMDCSLPGSSGHGILQARILEWFSMSSSRGSSQPRDRTWVSYCPALAGVFFTTSATWEAHGTDQPLTTCEWMNEVGLCDSKIDSSPTLVHGPSFVNPCFTEHVRSQRCVPAFHESFIFQGRKKVLLKGKIFLKRWMNMAWHPSGNLLSLDRLKLTWTPCPYRNLELKVCLWLYPWCPGNVWHIIGDEWSNCWMGLFFTHSVITLLLQAGVS